MRPLLIPCLLAALAATPSRPAPAQAPPADGGWLGRRVITQYGTVLRDGEQVVDDEGRSKNLAITGRDKRSFRIYKVAEVNGPWLLLVAEKGSAKGYAQAVEVIPFDQAIDYFTNQIRANPSSSTNYVNRSQIWRDKGELDIAIADLNEAIRLEPSSDVAYNNRGIVWSNKKDYDKAIADYTEAIRLDPRDASPYKNRGLAWRANKEYDKAIADYTEAIRLDPKGSWPYNSRAWLRATCVDAKLRDGKAAVEDATRACELSEWKEAYPIGTLAAAYAERGDFDKAVESQEKAQKLYKDEADIKKGLERLEFYRAKKPYRATPEPG